MFTGIIEHLGTVVSVQQQDPTEAGGSESSGWTITIGNAGPILGDCTLGDSICVNGTCLTVTHFTPTQFKVGVMQQSLRLTNLGDLSPGDHVNLERAVLSNNSKRMGGHFVQGHVDSTCTVGSITPDGNALKFTFDVSDPSLMMYIVPKGYIALDGISLTVVDVAQYSFTICMIAYTQSSVGLAKKKVGDRVNVEVDMLGKYVEKILGSVLGLDASETKSAFGAQLEAVVERVVQQSLDRRNIQ